MIYTCHERLFFYQRTIDADWHTFMRMFQKEHLEHGGANTSYQVNETEFGQSSSLYFKWWIGDDSMKVSYWKVGEDESKVDRTYIAPNDCGFKQ